MQQELLHRGNPEFAEFGGLVPNLFGAIELVLLIRLFSTSLVEHENRLSSRFNAEELSRVAPMLQSKYGGVTMDEQFKTHGAFSWFELMTTDPKAAKDFYTKLFGWTTEDMNMMPGMTYTVVKAAGKGIGGIMSMPVGAEELPPNWGTFVTVNDVDTVATNAQQLGGKVLMGPTDIPNVGRFCVIQDPQGAVISAITYADP